MGSEASKAWLYYMMGAIIFFDILGISSLTRPTSSFVTHQPAMVPAPFTARSTEQLFPLALQGHSLVHTKKRQSVSSIETDDPDQLYEEDSTNVTRLRPTEQLSKAAALLTAELAAGVAGEMLGSSIMHAEAASILSPELAASSTALSATSQVTLIAMLGAVGAVNPTQTAASLFGGYLLAFGSGNLRVDLVAGAIAVTLATIVTHPLDTMKTRIQLNKKPIGSKGVLGLYRGITYAILKRCPEASIYIALYYDFRRDLLRRMLSAEQLPFQAFLKCVFCASAAGTLAASVVKVPLEIVARQLQVGQSRGANELISKLFAGPGALGIIFWSWVTALLRDIPKASIQFGLIYVLEMMSSGLGTAMGIPIYLQRLIYAAIAGAISALLTNPLDLVCSKVMIELQERTKSMMEEEPHSYKLRSDGKVVSVSHRTPVLTCLRRILRDTAKERGIWGFWKGAWMRMLTTTPGVAVQYATLKAASRLLWATGLFGAQ